MSKVAADLSERDKTMLAWLPKLGEWYRVTPQSKLTAFESRVDCEVCSSKGDILSSNDGFALLSGTQIFITRIVLPKNETDPAILEFLSKKDGQDLTKTCFLPLYPPRTAAGAQIWKLILADVTGTEE